MIDHRVDRPEDILNFSGHGYVYDASRSTDNSPAFLRSKMEPLIFET